MSKKSGSSIEKKLSNIFGNLDVIRGSLRNRYGKELKNRRLEIMDRRLGVVEIFLGKRAAARRSRIPLPPPPPPLPPLPSGVDSQGLVSVSNPIPLIPCPRDCGLTFRTQEKLDEHISDYHRKDSKIIL